MGQLSDFGHFCTQPHLFRCVCISRISHMNVYNRLTIVALPSNVYNRLTIAALHPNVYNRLTRAALVYLVSLKPHTLLKPHVPLKT